MPIIKKNGKLDLTFKGFVCNIFLSMANASYFIIYSNNISNDLSKTPNAFCKSFLDMVKGGDNCNT